MSRKLDVRPEAGERIVFTKTIRLKTGRILVAAAYGLKAFPIKVKSDPAQLELPYLDT